VAQREIPQLRSPLARAFAPVLAGIAFFAALGLVLWLVAILSAKNPENIALGANTFEIGRVDRLSDSIGKTGPQLFPDLKSQGGQRSVILDHQGDDDLFGWFVYRPFALDSTDPDCFVTQTPRTRQFTDCNGLVLDVTQLQVATDVTVEIDNNILTLVFDGAVAPAPTLAPSDTSAANE
jgi:hypothetical protein